MESLRGDISDLENRADGVREWLRTPTTDGTKVRNAKSAELTKHREDLAGAQAKLQVMESSALDAPVTISQKAFDRAKKAGYAGLAAIVCNSAAGVLPVLFPS